MKFQHMRAGWWVVGALCTALMATGCGGGSAKKTDGGDASVDGTDGRFEVGGNGDGSADGPNANCATGDAKRADGETCTCGPQCASGFCAPEGVCCNQGCTEACKTCSATNKVGQCLSRAAG